MTVPKSRLFGLMAEFDTADQLLAAAKAAHGAGYRRMDGYSPLPVHGLHDALGFPPSKLQWFILGGGITGAISGFSLCFYASAIDYPLNIAGRPLNSWPSFVPVIFELTILFASLSAVFGMLGANKLPEPYHPVFHVKRFEHASRDQFFLAIEATDPRFDLVETRKFMEGLGGVRFVNEVPL